MSLQGLDSFEVWWGEKCKRFISTETANSHSFAKCKIMKSTWINAVCKHGFTCTLTAGGVQVCAVEATVDFHGEDSLHFLANELQHYHLVWVIYAFFNSIVFLLLIRARLDVFAGKHWVTSERTFTIIRESRSCQAHRHQSLNGRWHLQALCSKCHLLLKRLCISLLKEGWREKKKTS